MNSNHVDKPTTITAAEFVEGYYDLKIKRKECSVFRDEDYQGEIADIFPYYIGSKDLVVVYSDGLSELSYVTGEEQLTVEWLAQPATTDRDDSTPLLPQTVRDGDATLLGSKSIISPSEFLSGEYAYRIACDECQVTCFGQRIRTLSKRDDKGNYMIWPLNNNEVSGMAHDDDKLIVTWFPHTEDEWHEVGVRLERDAAAHAEFVEGWHEAEIARLTAEVERLQAALKPFADMFKRYQQLDYGAGFGEWFWIEAESRDITEWFSKAAANCEPDHR